MMKKIFLQRLIITSLAVGAINFSPMILPENNLQIISVAYANVENVVASDTAMFDFGEDDEKIVATVKNVARMRAVQAAKEKAGVYVKSFVKTVNGILTDDDVSAYASSNIEILDVQYKKIPYQAHDIKGNDTGKIGFMYEATVTAKIDTSDLSAYVERDAKEKSILIHQDKNSQQNIADISKTFDDLRNNAGEKNSEQIKSEINKIDNRVLAEQKFDEGNALFDKYHFKEAVEKYTEAINLDPNYAEAYHNRGLVYGSWRLKDAEKGLADLNKAIQLNPEDAESYAVRAEIYDFQDNYSEAIKDYTKAIQLDPNNVEYYAERGYLYDYKEKNYHAAMKDYAKAVQLDPNNEEYYFEFAEVFEIRLNDYPSAIKVYTDIIQRFPNSERIAKAYRARGSCYDWLNETEKSEADYAKAKE